MYRVHGLCVALISIVGYQPDKLVSYREIDLTINIDRCGFLVLLFITYYILLYRGRNIFVRFSGTHPHTRLQPPPPYRSRWTSGHLLIFVNTYVRMNYPKQTKPNRTMSSVIASVNYSINIQITKRDKSFRRSDMPTSDELEIKINNGKI